jgi:hypothetical protein
MKTKLVPLLIALAVAGITATATAGPGLDDFALRKQIADSHKASHVVMSDSGAVRYVANPSGKGGTVVRSESGATNIALFKSSKTDCGACCAKMKH